MAYSQWQEAPRLVVESDTAHVTPSKRAISARGAISACYWAAARNRTSTRTARTSGGRFRQL